MDTAFYLQAIDLHCVRQQKLLFAHISFQLNPGAALFAEGPNGSGKSSLLRLLSGIATPFAGEILWRGISILNARTEFSAEVHYLGHTNGIKLGLTVAENLELARKISLSAVSLEYDSILSALQLSAYKNTQACYLSAGQKRRIALAKLFLFPKKIWILDEPLTALDAHSQALFLRKLEDHLDRGGIAIISSHHAIQLPNTTTLRLAPC